jgi:hypothetical protein
MVILVTGMMTTMLFLMMMIDNYHNDDAAFDGDSDVNDNGKNDDNELEFSQYADKVQSLLKPGGKILLSVVPRSLFLSCSLYFLFSIIALPSTSLTLSPSLLRSGFVYLSHYHTSLSFYCAGGA